MPRIHLTLGIALGLCVGSLGCGTDEAVFDGPSGGLGGGGSGGAATGGSFNGSGGNPATGGGGGAGASGGAGGSAPLVCGPAPGTVGQSLLLYTTLDDPASVTAPSAGDGSNAAVVTQPADDFQQVGCGPGAVQIDAATEMVTFRQRVGGTDHIDFDRGTLDFNFVPGPGFSVMGSQDFFFFVADTGGNGGFRMRKANDANLNHLQFLIIDGNGFVGEAQVRPTDLPFVQGTPTRITITWDFTVSGQQVRIYFDGVEAPYPDGTGPNDNGSGIVADTTPNMPSPRNDEDIVIGNEPAGQDPAHGLIDDFKIYDEVIVP